MEKRHQAEQKLRAAGDIITAASRIKATGTEKRHQAEQKLRATGDIITAASRIKARGRRNGIRLNKSCGQILLSLKTGELK